MYHRVAAPAVDPWGLAVHPDHFAEHMEVLRAQRTPLPMSEIVRRLEDGTLPDNAVAVTFDDGYVDNVCEARPRLDAAGVPATIFLVTGALGQRTNTGGTSSRAASSAAARPSMRDTRQRRPLPADVPGGERFGG